MNIQQSISPASGNEEIVPAKTATALEMDMTEPDTGEAPDRAYWVADRLHHAAIATASLGISPISLIQAYQDWVMHLAISPGKQHEILRKFVRKQMRFYKYLADTALTRGDAEACIKPLPQDHRFLDPAWTKFPFGPLQQYFLLTQQWWHNATTGVAGVTAQHERLTEFYARQILDMFSPSNFLLTNPAIINQTIKEGGANLIRGAGYMLDDALKAARHKPVEIPFEPGKDVAVTPGEVVYRDELIELIQYAPTTGEVQTEPLLIVPAWIMKYYILDLSPENSLIRYMVAQGFTVFCISWVNPDSRHREIGMEDYVQKGLMAAVDAVQAITGADQMHAAGYCLGGTLLSIAASAMVRDGDHRLKSLTMLAAQVDFSEPGELGLFIDESQLSFLEDVMWQKGYLDQWQMAGAFQMLRSQDLVWSRMVNEYLMGDRPKPNDLMSWNADATRMPYRMHTDYLRHLYLANDLSQGRFTVGGRHIHLEDIYVPVFAVGTVTDHVAPWRSVFKLVHFFDTDVDFVLTSGGHNAGIVSEPGHPHRSFRALHYTQGGPHPDAEEWAEKAATQQGSWWPKWANWLKERSSGKTAASQVGNAEAGYPPIEPAPGSYVRMR